MDAAWLKQAAHLQKGIALYTTSIVLMLCMLLALWATKSAIFFDMVSSNHADYQRAFEAAQAMVEDAKADIYAHLHASAAPPPLSSGSSRFPNHAQNWAAWSDRLQTAGNQRCAQGVCLRTMAGENFWEDETALSHMLAGGARYGSYSGQSSGSGPNPILAQSSSQGGAWYWIEPMRLDEPQIQWSQLPSGPNTSTWLFRITGLAYGLKASANPSSQRPSTMAVIQTVLAAPVQTAADGSSPKLASPLRTLQWRQMQ